MRESLEMSKKVFYTIVGVCAVIIMLTSIEMLLRTKDVDMFNLWLSSEIIPKELLSQSEEQIFATYVNMNLGIFITRVITPIAVALHTYFTFTKLRVNKMYVIIWSVIIIGAIALLVLSESYFSIFFVGSLIGHIALVIIMIYLGKCINDVKSI